ncbi:Nse4 C-terminal-domain-containing protein [Ostreococcus tauri]|uniref:Non-structural maintenance of chromosomes element 4 n=1 Tax=Ostreococcus tauri TaxID=70448 RepID=A0A1Y5HZY7_OSTTA|nr:Nse4 C-terminal-domain-containing protein [Ostreococcus tauri]
MSTPLDAHTVNQDELSKPESDELDRAVDRADAINETGVREKREMVLDMELYNQLTAYARTRTARLGPRGSAEYFSDAPVPGFMNGVMDTAIKERRATQRRAKEVLGPSVAPDAVEDTTAERQTDKMMQAMHKKLKKCPGGVTDVVHAVRNLESFPQFVENVFTAAFLVREGAAGITPSPSGGVPTLSHQVKPAAGADRASFVLHVDMKNWRALNALANGQAGLMPTREDVDEDVLYGARGTRRAGEDALEYDDTKRVRTGEHLHDSTNERRLPRDSVSS